MGIHRQHGSTYEVNPLPKTFNVIFHGIMITGMLMAILPVLLIFIIAFTNESVLFEEGYCFIPSELSLNAFKFLIKSWGQIVDSYMVSIFVTVFGTILSLFLMSMFAYVISRRDYKYRKLFTFIVIFTMLFNGGLVSQYIIYTNVFHLKDQIWALILPYTVNAFYIIILRTFFANTIPISIIESAKIDGASELNIYFKLILPLSKPALATVGMFSVVGYWNDWYLGLLYITKPKLVPIQYMLMKVQSSIEFVKQNATFFSTAEGAKMLKELPSETARMALVVLTITPILFIYPFFQKYFVAGLTVGSVKE